MTYEEAIELIQHSVDSEIVVDVPEHEVLLSFNDDDGAFLFNTWWQEMGHKLFAEWTAANAADVLSLP